MLYCNAFYSFVKIYNYNNECGIRVKMLQLGNGSESLKKVYFRFLLQIIFHYYCIRSLNHLV
jgi:hypothetical protein